MGVVELALAAWVAVAGGLASGLPVEAWLRTRERRLLLVAGADLGLVVLGVIWIYGQLPVNPPDYAVSDWPVLLVAAVIALCLLATGVVPRRR